MSIHTVLPFHISTYVLRTELLSLEQISHYNPSIKVGIMFWVKILTIYLR
jgi:hypothetical protein